MTWPFGCALKQRVRAGTRTAFTCRIRELLAPESGFRPAFREQRSLLFASAVSGTQAASPHTAV
jgi:hypothetical protein